MQPLRILIVDNAISHRKVMRAAMEEVLAALPGGGITEFATTVEETQLLLTSFQPNAITVNFAMSILRIDDTPFVPWLVRTARVPTIAYGLSDVLRDAARARNRHRRLFHAPHTAQRLAAVLQQDRAVPAASRVPGRAAHLRAAASSCASRHRLARSACPAAAPADGADCSCGEHRVLRAAAHASCTQCRSHVRAPHSTSDSTSCSCRAAAASTARSSSALL